MVNLADVQAAWTGLPEWIQTAVQIALLLLVGVFFRAVGHGLLRRALRKSKHIDATTRGFLLRTISFAVWLAVIFVALGLLGVDTVALAGGLAVGGFIVGFALKDSLGNLAAGIMLLLYRPFNVGDNVTLDGEQGDVRSLGMALTTIKAGDGRIVTIPNGKVLGGTITNHTREPIRRADVLVGIGYDDDIDTAVRAIMDAVAADERVLEDPAPSVRIRDLGDSAVGLQVRPWVNTEDFWKARADMHGIVKRALERAGCSIPYPQQDIHIITGAPGESHKP